MLNCVPQGSLMITLSSLLVLAVLALVCSEAINSALANICTSESPVLG
jgi:hypothetical protein